MAPQLLASLSLALLALLSLVDATQKVMDATACPDYKFYATYPQYVFAVLF